MRDWGTAAVAGWLLALGAACTAGFVALARFFVRTEHGQKIDTIALTGNSIGQARIDDFVDTVLNAMSVVSLASAAAVVAFIALIRGRRGLALMVLLLIAGSNVTTQVAKLVITRPNLGVDVERAAAGNSLPSGHTTVAASVAIALVLVLPPRVRALGAFIAAAYAALAGVATMSAGWHRPSDAMAALLIVGGWASLVSILLLLARRRGDRSTGREAHRASAVVLVLAGIVLLMLAAVAMELTEQVRDYDPSELGERRLFAAYAGGAAGIVGTASLLVGLVLATVHRVVPQRLPDPDPGTLEDGEPTTVALRSDAADPPTVRLPAAGGDPAR
jgi:membrane-associated phospholipid phosphatase